MGVDNWSTTPADNAIQGNIDWSEGMAPAKVNDSARDMMAQIARNILDRSGALTSTGSAGVYALATNTGITQLKSGLRFTFKANVDFAAGSTLNVDAKGGKKLRVVNDDGERDVEDGEVVAAGFYDVIYDTAANSGAGAWIVQTADFTAITADIASVQSSLTTHTTDTENPHSVTKAQVGLGNVDNTSDADKPVSTAQAAADALKLAKASNLSDLANKTTARSNLSVMSSAEVSTAISNMLANYYSKTTADNQFLIKSAGGTIDGSVTINGDFRVTGVGWNTDRFTIEGASPNIHFSQTDGEDAYVGINTATFYVLGDLDDDGSYDSPPYAFEFRLDGTLMRYSGNEVWHAGNDGAGSGLNADTLDDHHADDIMSIGINQTWQDMTSSRSGGTSYQNTTGRPIMVSIHNCDGFFSVSANNSDWLQIESGVAGVDFPHVSHIIPAGWYYKVQTFSSAARQWHELR